VPRTYICFPLILAPRSLILAKRSELAVESGTWIIVGLLVVGVMVMSFCRAPRTAREPTESLSERWFGKRLRRGVRVP
jgi:hypothetical protein